MKLLIVSASLNPDSNSRLLAHAAAAALTADAVEHHLVDLRDLSLPLCDGDSAYAHPNVAVAGKLVREADGIILAAPIYNYDVNSALKNLVELTGKAWEDKTVAFLTAAGGPSSYMSIMAFANSLMLDFRCVIVPRFVYAVPGDFVDGTIANPKIAARVAECARSAARLTAQRAKA